ncbi:hypothetical protein QUC32_26785 (plasmid) [Novosphingobium resinovorum]|uniref:hypothetical protein n=1 Tax=Novosphingobium TaxID=165696 RepID=UPI001B3C7A5E|nr:MULTISPECIES: hypothetical protein [Novosphingobium]MBF7015318.1 hypothetical protein [Novosphingobium sp. HR1a]WJM29997.1 hypothetical protein QUC32_26785 [Novosphingobium resinovorum]
MSQLATETYIRRETRISVAINAAISLLFYVLVFGGRNPVNVWGAGQWVLDFLPQGFMIALMGTLVPGLLAARRLRAGSILPLGKQSPLPRNLALRGLLLALVSAFVCTGVVALTMRCAGPETLPAWAAASIKVALGALLAAIVTPIGLRSTLAQSA